MDTCSSFAIFSRSCQCIPRLAFCVHIYIQTTTTIIVDTPPRRSLPRTIRAFLSGWNFCCVGSCQKIVRSHAHVVGLACLRLMYLQAPTPYGLAAANSVRSDTTRINIHVCSSISRRYLHVRYGTAQCTPFSGSPNCTDISNAVLLNIYMYIHICLMSQCGS